MLVKYARNAVNSSDRQFFAALADVVFGNPFSPERDALIVRLAPGAPPGDLSSDREALARVVAPRLAAWLGRDASARRTGGWSSRRCSTSATTARCRTSTR